MFPNRIAAFLPLALTGAFAVADPLVADRPDFTNGTLTVAPGVHQIELGYTYSEDAAGGTTVRSHTLPELMYRTGLTEQMELRLSWDGATRYAAGGRSDEEMADMAAGFKWRLLDDPALSWRMSLLGALSLPSGSSGASSGGYDPDLQLALGTDLSDTLSLAAAASIGWPTDNDKRYTQTSASLSLGISLNETSGAYVEWYTVSAEARGADPVHYVDAGMNHYLSDDLAVDARIGHGISGDATDLYAGVGCALRF